MVFGGFQQIKVGPVTLGRYGKGATPVYSVIRKLYSELVSNDVHIWSSLSGSMISEWRRMWWTVKNSSDRCGAPPLPPPREGEG
jgi:hypothetical protein